MFHGTSYRRGLKIIESGFIKKDVERVYGKDHLFPTTNGYVYLTNNIFRAIYFGDLASWDDGDKKLMVFSLEIDEELLEPDIDDINYTFKNYFPNLSISDPPTLEESLMYTFSARVAQDIDLKKHKGKYTIMVSTHSRDDGWEETREANTFKNDPDNEYARKLKEKLMSKRQWIEVS